MATPRRQHSQEEGAKRGIRARMWVLGGVFALCFGGLAVRAVQLQVMQNPRLTAEARDQYDRQFELPGMRGQILDRQGRELAASVDVDSVFIDPSLLKSRAELQAEEAEARRRAQAKGKAYRPPASDEVRDRAQALPLLAKALGISSSRVEKMLDGGRKFAWLKRRATPQEVSALKATRVAGLGFQKEPRRFYPQRELAAHLLGFSNIDGKGIEGLERAFDEELRGRRGVIGGLRDARGRAALMDGAVPIDTLKGATLTLTLDSVVQYQTEKAVQAAVAKFEAVAGMAVVLDPRTGEILALANAPTFNPNTPSKSDAASRRNRAVADQQEPGSTLKPITVAAALEEKVVTPDTVFDGEKGHMRIGRHTIHDSHPHGSMTVSQVIQVSSNIGVAKIAALLGRDKLQAYFRAFGFGEKPGSELPGEARGALPYPRAEIALATQSFGHGMSASALQIAAAYGALANGGRLMRPYLVSKIVDAEGKVLLDRRPQEVRRVVSEKTARQVLDMMQLVVEQGGTGRAARLDDYKVAAKSGTAQKVDPAGGYSKTKRLASFAGMVPADDPRLVIVVSIDEPTTNVYGGIVAAPAFKEIAQNALAHLGVSPMVKQRTSSVAISEESSTPAPTTLGRARLASAFAMATLVPEDAEAAGEGFVEVDAEEAPDAPAVELRQVPFVQGLPARAAVSELVAADLDPHLAGSGTVVSQSPPAGASVRRGSKISLQLETKL